MTPIGLPAAETSRRNGIPRWRNVGMAKARSSVRKREREVQKRQRELKKSKKAAEKRERRFTRDGKEPSEPSDGADAEASREESSPDHTAG